MGFWSPKYFGLSHGFSERGLLLRMTHFFTWRLLLQGASSWVMSDSISLLISIVLEAAVECVEASKLSTREILCVNCIRKVLMDRATHIISTNTLDLTHTLVRCFASLLFFYLCFRSSSVVVRWLIESTWTIMMMSLEMNILWNMFSLNCERKNFKDFFKWF